MAFWGKARVRATNTVAVSGEYIRTAAGPGSGVLLRARLVVSLGEAFHWAPGAPPGRLARSAVKVSRR
jgi:hypothetical protein